MEQELTSKMAELQMKIQHLDSLHRERLQEVRTLSYHLSRVISANPKNGTVTILGDLKTRMKIIYRAKTRTLNFYIKKTMTFFR